MSYYTKSKFYNDYSQKERRDEFERIINKYPDRFPVIIEKGESELQEIRRKKYLIPNDLTIGQLLIVVRKNIDTFDAEKALFIMAGETIMSASKEIKIIYNDLKANDGFLYLNYYGEKTFG